MAPTAPTEEDLGFVPAIKQPLRYGRGKPYWQGAGWIVISLVVHATAFGCCAYLAPMVISSSHASADHESMHLHTSAAMLGEGFDWNDVPAFSPQEKPLQVLKIEPAKLPAPTELPVMVRQEPPLPVLSDITPTTSKPNKDLLVESQGTINCLTGLLGDRSRSPRNDTSSVIASEAKQSSLKEPENKQPVAVARTDIKNLKADEPSTGKIGWHTTASESKSKSGIGSGNSTSQLIYNPAPEYPSDALAARLTGRVLLRVAVRADGTVQSATLFRTSGVDMLDEAALKIIDSWRFAPRDLPGDVWEVVVPINFAIEEP